MFQRIHWFVWAALLASPHALLGATIVPSVSWAQTSAVNWFSGNYTWTATAQVRNRNSTPIELHDLTWELWESDALIDDEQLKSAPVDTYTRIIPPGATANIDFSLVVSSAAMAQGIDAIGDTGFLQTYTKITRVSWYDYDDEGNRSVLVVTPEPVTWLCSGAGLLLLAICRGRRRGTLLPAR